MENEKVTALSTDDALFLLRDLIGDESAVIRVQLENNEIDAFTINECHFIACIVEEYNGKFLVIMYATGKNLISACKILKRLALENKCVHVRIFTKRKGMAKLMKTFNLIKKETIFEAVL
jgi:hypothetical protein